MLFVWSTWMYNISSSSNPSRILPVYVSSRPIPTFSLKSIVKVIQRSPPLLLWLWFPPQAAPPPRNRPPLCRSVHPPCLCGYLLLWASVAFWAALSLLWKFSTAIDATKTNQDRMWKQKEINSDSDFNFTLTTMGIFIWQDVGVILQCQFVQNGLNWGGCIILDNLIR